RPERLGASALEAADPHLLHDAPARVLAPERPVVVADDDVTRRQRVHGPAPALHGRAGVGRARHDEHHADEWDDPVHSGPPVACVRGAGIGAWDSGHRAADRFREPAPAGSIARDAPSCGWTTALSWDGRMVPKVCSRRQGHAEPSSHSTLRLSAGDTRAALAAGASAAASASTSSMPNASPYARGSSLPIPNSGVGSTAVAANASAPPATTPTAASRAVRASTSRTMTPAVAPSAARTPSSRVCRPTMPDTATYTPSAASSAVTPPS